MDRYLKLIERLSNHHATIFDIKELFETHDRLFSKQLLSKQEKVAFDIIFDLLVKDTLLFLSKFST